MASNLLARISSLVAVASNLIALQEFTQKVDKNVGHVDPIVTKESSAKPLARKDRDRGQTARNAETHCPHALSKQKCWLKQELWIPGRCQRQRGGWERMFDVNRKQECVLLYCAVAGRQRGSQEEKGGHLQGVC